MGHRQGQTSRTSTASRRWVDAPAACPAALAAAFAALGCGGAGAVDEEGTPTDDDSALSDDDDAADPCADGPDAADLLPSGDALDAPERAWSATGYPVSAETGAVEGVTFTWSADGGTFADPAAPSTTWTAPSDFEGNKATFDLRLDVRHPCAEASAEAEVRVVRRDVERVVIVANADVPAGLEVADHYAAARGIDPGRVVAVAATAAETLSLADYQALVETPVRDFVGSQGLDGVVTYFVTVHGVPYHVDGVAPPLGWDPDNGWWPVSLDSLLGAMGAGVGAFGVEGLLPNPLYLDGDSPTLSYAEPRRAVDAVAQTDGRFIPVARLDGPTPEDAIALVDRAREAEDLARQGALPGLAYIDRQYAEDPASDVFGTYESVEWALKASADLLRAAGYEVVLDTHLEEFGTAPAPTACPDALWYSGWYSYDHYPDCFTWAPGAVGIHFDSCSACSLQGGGNFAVQAVQRGITATVGAVNEPFVFGLPDMDHFWWHLSSGENLAEAAWQSTYFVRWMSTVIGDPLYNPFDPDREP